MAQSELVFNREKFKAVNTKHVEEVFEVAVSKTQVKDNFVWVRLVGASQAQKAARRYLNAICEPQTQHGMILPSLLVTALQEDVVVKRLEREFSVYIPPNSSTNDCFFLQGDEVAVALAASQIEQVLDDESWEEQLSQDAAASRPSRSDRKSRLSLDTQLSEEVSKNDLNLDVNAMQNAQESIKRSFLKSIHNYEIEDNEDTSNDDVADADRSVMIVGEEPASDEDCVITGVDEAEKQVLPKDKESKLRTMGERLGYKKHELDAALASHSTPDKRKLNAHQFVDSLRVARKTHDTRSKLNSNQSAQTSSMSTSNSSASLNDNDVIITESEQPTSRVACPPTAPDPTPAPEPTPGPSTPLLPMSVPLATPSRANCAYRPIVMDGSNVAVHYGKGLGLGKMFMWEGIFIAYNHFIEMGVRDVYVVVPNNTQGYVRSNPQNEAKLAMLRERGHLICSPTRLVRDKLIKGYDDILILDISHDHDAVVLSNDQYRDLLSRDPHRYRFVIENRLLPYNFVRHSFYPAKDPLGPAGPSLGTFLLKGERRQFLDFSKLRSGLAGENSVRGPPRGLNTAALTAGTRQPCGPSSDNLQTSAIQRPAPSQKKPTIDTNPAIRSSNKTRSIQETKALFKQLNQSLQLPQDLVRHALKMHPRERNASNLASIICENMSK